MAKFYFECPSCKTLNQASTSIFAKKEIVCSGCSTVLDVKDNRFQIRACPECGSVFAIDQSKGDVKCPSCGCKSNKNELGKINNIACPSCGTVHQVYKESGVQECALCSTKIDIATAIAKANAITPDTGSVIRYEGNTDVLVWKHPVEDFNNNTVLIVHESQEAVFFLNGVGRVYGAGRHVLNPETVDYNFSTGLQKAYHAEVYFVNKTVQMNMKWGTADRVKFREPKYGAFLDLGAAGTISVQVSDSKKLINKLIGTTSGAKWEASNEAESLSTYFKPLISTVVTSSVPSIITERKINILDLDMSKRELSSALQATLSDELAEYGLNVAQFLVMVISLPENDPNFKRIKALNDSALDNNVEDSEYEREKIRRQRNLEREKEDAQWELEKARQAAELKRIKAQGDADEFAIKTGAVNDATLQVGMNQARVEEAMGIATGNSMNAQGYTKKDEFDRDVRVASALVNGQQSAQNEAPAAKAEWTCPACGTAGNTGKCCSECGKQKVEPTWTCLACGETGNKGKCCSECGKPRFDPEWTCPSCGQTGNKGKCCTECGFKRK